MPSSRIGRAASFGQLFAGLGIGTIGELTKGALGMGGATNVKEAFLSPQNTERIVDTLCKVRGAALKLGQILSIQDTNVVSPQLIQAFDRVRQAGEFSLRENLKISGHKNLFRLFPSTSRLHAKLPARKSHEQRIRQRVEVKVCQFRRKAVCSRFHRTSMFLT